MGSAATTDSPLSVGCGSLGSSRGGDVAPPSAPGNLVATPGSASVLLTWDAVDGATSYNIYDGSSDIQVGSTADVEFNVTGLDNGTEYFFYVTAVNAAGEGAQSSTVSATPTPPPPPDAPTGFTAETRGHGVFLQWDAVSGADSYEVYRDGVMIGTPTEPNMLDSDEALYLGSTYTYKARTVSGGVSSDDSDEDTAGPSYYAPTGIGVSSFVAADPTGFTVTFTPSSDGDNNHLVQYKESSSDTWVDGGYPYDSAALTGLSTNTRYDVRVRTNESGDNLIPPSEWVYFSNILTCPPPPNVSGSYPSGFLVVEVSWFPVTDAVSYTVRHYIDGVLYEVRDNVSSGITDGAGGGEGSSNTWTLQVVYASDTSPESGQSTSISRPPD